MKKILNIIVLLSLLVSCGNKTYYESNKKIARLIGVNNGIAQFRVYDTTLRSSEEDFIKRMNDILLFYNLEGYIFELYNDAALKKYDIIDIRTEELMIVNDILLETKREMDVPYRKYETSDILKPEDIIKVCESNKRTGRERNVIYFEYKFMEYASTYKHNEAYYTIYMKEHNGVYSAELKKNEWVIKENLNTIAVEEKIKSPTERKKTVDPLVGSYKCDRSKDVYVFHADGTGEFFAAGSTSSSSFTWNRFVDDITILYKVYGEQKLKFNLSNKTITEKSPSLGTLVFRKIN